MIFALITYLLPFSIARIVANSVLSQKCYMHLLTSPIGLFTIRPVISSMGKAGLSGQVIPDTDSKQRRLNVESDFVTNLPAEMSLNGSSLTLVTERISNLRLDCLRRPEYEGKAYSFALHDYPNLKHHISLSTLAYQFSPTLSNHTDSLNSYPFQTEELPLRSLSR